MNVFGKNFRVSVFGESHGAGIGVVLDGVPAGLELSADDFAADLARRKSGAKGTTPRKEDDIPEILSGVMAGHTTGAPVAVLFRNGNTRPSDYSLFKEMPRPGHADFVAGVKWHDFNDPRGGGHFSGRVTLCMVAAGVVAKKMLHSGYALERLAASGLPLLQDDSRQLFSVEASVVEVGGVPLSEVEIPGERNPSVLWSKQLDAAIADGDSLGGVVECKVENMPVGLGEPFFDSVESLVSHIVFSIPGVRGIEFGDGFRAARMKGSEHNDPVVSPAGSTSGNGAGGINGGITNGNPVVFRVAFKPTSSIRMTQHTWNFTAGRISSLDIPGRHDVCFALRTPVIVESAAAIVLADLLLSLR